MSGKRAKQWVTKYASVISVGLILSFSGYLTFIEFQYRQTQVIDESEIMLSQVSDAIQSEIQKRIDILLLFRDTWLSTKDISHCYSEQRFETIIPSYYNVTPGFKAINWIDVNGTVRWIYPYDDNIGVLNKSIIYLSEGELNTGYKYAQETGKMGTMGVFTLYQGGYGFITIIPLKFNSTLTGYLNGVFDLNILFGEILRPEYGFVGIDQYSVDISFNNKQIHQQGENFTQSDPYVIAKELPILDSFDITIALRPLTLIINELSIWSNGSIMLLGITLAGVVGILVQSLLKRNELLRVSSHEKEELMHELHIRQKMESLGTLAGGVAHDFNNLLAGIQGNVSLVNLNLQDLQEGMEKPKLDIITEINTDLQEVQNLIKNSGKIINQITQFSRSSSSEFEPMNTTPMIENLLQGFRKTIDRRIITTHKLTEEDVYILGDTASFNQILLNLWINARDAISPDSGEINVQSRIIPKSKTPLKPAQITDHQFHGSPSELYDSHTELEVTLSDTGIGIPPEIQSKIFDPFFSTKKDARHGAGLGLTIVYNNIKSMDGTINVSSKIGEGTTFTLRFPILDRHHYSQKVDPKSKVLEEPSIFNFQNLVILVIEDEETIKHAVQRFLQKKEATVYSASIGTKGLNLYKSFSHQFDLVILDINLPGMNGIDVYEQIKKITPNQPVLFITGFSDHGIPPRDEYDLGVLTKPFELDKLARKVQNLKKI